MKNVLYNPVYMGKIAYGRRRTEKKQGTRNEMHVVEQSEFPVYEGQHEAIISEEDWYLAQEKAKINSLRERSISSRPYHILWPWYLKCPCCGKRRPAISPRRTARTRKHGIITTAKIRLHRQGMMQFPSEYRADGNQQICGEGYLRYGQQSTICRSNSGENRNSS